MEPDVDTMSNQSLDILYSQVNRMAHDLPGPLRRVRVRSGAVTVEVEWHPAPAVGPQQARVELGPPHTDGVVPAGLAEGEPQAAVPVAGETVLASPMVGTFYRAGNPAEPPFVEVGDLVEQGQTVGVIEAMKLFNPITAESSGVVAEILVKDAEPVEFAQPLLRLVVGQDGPAAAEER